MSEWTVQDLITALGELPPDAPVILSRDSEGNGYSPLAFVEQGMGRPRRAASWEWEVHPLENAIEAGDMPKLVVVLSPVW